MADIGEDLRKLALAGIGAASTAAEKAGKLVDEFSKRGESVVAHGRDANQQLKHHLRETLWGNETAAGAKPDLKAVLDALDSFAPEEREAVRAKLSRLGEEPNEPGGE